MPGFKLFVQKLTGEIFTLEEMDTRDSIDEVKRMIEEASKIPKAAQHLIYDDIALWTDEFTLADYGVLPEGTLHLLVVDCSNMPAMLNV